MSNPASDKRVALITGGNKGLGYEIARQLGQDHGMTVLVGSARRGTRPGRAASDKLGWRRWAWTRGPIRLDVTDSGRRRGGGRRQIEPRLRRPARRAGQQRRACALDLGPAEPDGPGRSSRRPTRRTRSARCVVTKAMLPLLKRSAAGSRGQRVQRPGFPDAERRPVLGVRQGQVPRLPLVQGGAEHADGAPRGRTGRGGELRSRSTRPTPATRPPTSTTIKVTAPSMKARAPQCVWRRCPPTGRRASSSTRTGRSPGER